MDSADNDYYMGIWCFAEFLMNWKKRVYRRNSSIVLVLNKDIVETINTIKEDFRDVS